MWYLIVSIPDLCNLTYFDEIPAMPLQDIKKTKRYGRTDARTDGQREYSLPTTNKVCGGINILKCNCSPYSTLMTMYLPDVILCSNEL